MTFRPGKKGVVILILVIAAIIFVMYAGFILTDYNIKFDGGIQLVSKTPVAGSPGFSVNNTVPGKLTVTIAKNGSPAYDVQISMFSNMFFPKTYRIDGTTGSKTLGMLFEGTTYYLRARSVANKPNSARKVNGLWGKVRSVTVKKGR